MRSLMKSEVQERYLSRRAQRLRDAATPLLEELSEAHEEDRPAKCRRLTVAYFKGRFSRLWAAKRALPHTASDRRIEALAERLNVFGPEEGVIRWWPAPKAGGTGHRPITNLPTTLMAKHYLIRDVLGARFSALSHIYDYPLRGRDRAAMAVKEAWEAGFRHLYVGDVRDCYQHVQTEALTRQLPLPKKVVEHSLVLTNLPLRRREQTRLLASLDNGSGIRWNGPRGLLQGSPVSSLILAILFNAMAAKLDPHECRLFLVSDNVLIAAKSEAARNAAMTLVCDFLREHPAGPFNLKEEDSFLSPAADFEYLGYAFRPVGEKLMIEPSERGWDRLWGSLAEAEIAPVDERLKAFELALRNRLSGYTAWGGRLDFRDDILWSERTHLLGSNPNLAID